MMYMAVMAQEARADGEPNSGALPMLLPVTHAEAAPSIPPLVPPPSLAAGPRAIPPSFTRAYMTQLIMPQHANSLGITFGGQVMKYVERSFCRNFEAIFVGLSVVGFFVVIGCFSANCIERYPSIKTLKCYMQPCT